MVRNDIRVAGTRVLDVCDDDGERWYQTMHDAP